MLKILLFTQHDFLLCKIVTHKQKHLLETTASVAILSDPLSVSVSENIVVSSAYILEEGKAGRTKLNRP